MRKHELLQQHKAAEAAHRAHRHPEFSSMEVVVQHMECEELEQVSGLFNTAYYLVEFEQLLAIIQVFYSSRSVMAYHWGMLTAMRSKLKPLWGLSLKRADISLCNHFERETLLVFFFYKSTDPGNIDKEMVQVRVLENNRPIYKFVAIKPLDKPKAANTVAAAVESLNTDCELSNWHSKLMGLIVLANGAVVNMGVKSGAVKRLQDQVPHPVAVNCSVHWVELAIKTFSTNVAFLNHCRKPC